MPLFKKSKKSEMEMEEGDSPKKSLAIAYAMRGKKMAKGGMPCSCKGMGCEMCYSEGGMVANETPITAGFEENEFDDLALRDHLESKYTGANSGDEKSTLGQHDRMEDMYQRIMMAKKNRKQSNPRPA